MEASNPPTSVGMRKAEDCGGCARAAAVGRSRIRNGSQRIRSAVTEGTEDGLESDSEEDGRRETENRGQETEDRGRRTEDRETERVLT